MEKELTSTVIGHMKAFSRILSIAQLYHDFVTSIEKLYLVKIMCYKSFISDILSAILPLYAFTLRVFFLKM